MAHPINSFMARCSFKFRSTPAQKLFRFFLRQPNISAEFGGPWAGWRRVCFELRAAGEAAARTYMPNGDFRALV
jgi:hypothetical protein